MDALEATFHGQIKTGEGWPEFTLDGASWIEAGQVWVLELVPDNSPLTGRSDPEGTHEPQNAEIVELQYSSVQSKQQPELGLAAQHGSDGIKSCTSGRLQTQETFAGNGEAFKQSLELSTRQRSPCEKLLLCHPCGKAFRYPSDLARHRRVHSRQKAAKRSRSRSEADGPGLSEPPQLPSRSENAKSSRAFRQKSKAVTGQNTRPRKHFCEQCGKAFRCLSELARHQSVHSRQKAGARSRPRSQVGSPSLSEATQLAVRMENTTSSEAFHQKSEAVTGHNTRPSKRHFCEQCGKAFQYPSQLAQHQSVHSRQKAGKRSRSQSDVDSPGPLESTLLATRQEITPSSKAFPQKSKAVTGQNTRPRTHLCEQCGKAFRCLSELARHQSVHSRQKAGKHSRSQSDVGSPGPLESTLLATRQEITPSSKVFRQESEAVTGQNTRPRTHFCEQCGKAFRYPTELAQHQCVHSRQKAGARSRSPSEGDSPNLLEPTQLAIQMENTTSNDAFHQTSEAVTGQEIRLSKRHLCEQCGKAFQYPSQLTQHQSVHSRQKAGKWAQSPSEAGNPIPLESTLLASQQENTNSSNAFHPTSKAMTGHNTRPRKQYFCDHCGKAFWYPSHLAQHRCAHSRQKAGTRSQSQSEGDSHRLSEPALLASQQGNTKSSKAFRQKSQAVTGLKTRRRKQHFCDQCGKAFWYRSHVDRHQSVHSRRKGAKWAQSPSEAADPCPLESALLASKMENTKSSKAFHQKSMTVTGHNALQSKQHFCDQCGKAFWYPFLLAQHQLVHSRQKAGKRCRSHSEGDIPRLLETTLLVPQVENTKSSKAFHQKPKATTGRDTLPRKQYFCGQCGKAFRYPSFLAHHQLGKRCRSGGRIPSVLESAQLASQMENTKPSRRQYSCGQCEKAFRYPSHLSQHQSAHSGQRAAKRAHPPAAEHYPRPLELTPLATPVEDTSVSDSKVLCQNSATDQSRRHHRKRRSCAQCGDSSDLTRHQHVRSRRKAEKWSRSLSRADRPSLPASSRSALQKENSFGKSCKALCQTSKATTGQETRHRKRHFCGHRGKGWQRPSELARPQCVRSGQKAPKRSQSSPEADNRSPLDVTSLIALVENISINSSNRLGRRSKVTRQGTRRERQLFCKRCGEAFRFPSDLARHRSEHSRQKRIRSQSEGGSSASLGPTPVERRGEGMFANPSKALRRNSKRTRGHHSRRGKRHFCGRCEKAFRYRSDLARHRLMHSRRKAAIALPEVTQREEAPASPSEAVSPSPTQMTGRRARPKKLYLCGQCGESFGWRSELTQHEYTHFQERCYSCGVCGRQFRRRVQLAKHQKWHEDSQEGGGGGETFHTVIVDDGVGEYEAISELMPDLPPKAAGELCEAFARPETCECGVCQAEAKETPALLPANSMWEIGISGQSYPLPLLPACERRSDEADGEEGSAPQPAEPALLHAEVPPSTAPASPASSSEIFTPMPEIFTPTDPAASPGADAHVASPPEEKTSATSIATSRAARRPQSNNPDPEWVPSRKRPRRSQKQARSSSQGSGPHACPICSKRFKVSEYLKKHLNIHRQGKPYSCTLCGQRFGQRSYALKHLRFRHSEEPEGKIPSASIAVDRVARRPQISNPDPEWVPSRDSPRRLRKPARSSTRGADPHSCPVCSKSFRLAEYLKRHLDVHQQGKPYSCTLCGQRFGRQSYLTRHCQRMHSEAGSPLSMMQELFVSTP